MGDLHRPELHVSNATFPKLDIFPLSLDQWPKSAQSVSNESILLGGVPLCKITEASPVSETSYFNELKTVDNVQNDDNFSYKWCLLYRRSDTNFAVLVRHVTDKSAWIHDVIIAIKFGLYFSCQWLWIVQTCGL
jgi:hypothetical protein